MIAVVAEDEPILRIEAVDLLEEAGFSVLDASTAARALRLIEETDQVRLLLTDVQMPGEMNGFDLARIVTARWPQIVVVICSGALTPRPGELPSGSHFIGKPLSSTVAQELLSMLFGTSIH